MTENTSPFKIISRIIPGCAVLFLAFILPAFSEPVNGPSARTHVVRWGDTLAKIACRYYGDGKQYSFLAEQNHLKSPHRILCGESLLIPPLPVTAAEAPKNIELEPLVPMLSSATVTEVMPTPLPVVEGQPAFVWRQETSDVFGPGEKLTFAVRWKFITVGYATMAIKGVEDLSGRPAYHIVTDARSAPFFDTFYKVRDTNESWMDVGSLCSLKFASHIEENSSRKNETMLLDQEKQEFTIVESGKTGGIAQWSQDVLSSLYYLRTKPLEVGKSYSIDTHSGDKSWPLVVNVVKREKIRVPAGEFDCVIVEPKLKEGAGIFQSKGKLWVWLTNDEHRIPVLMRSKIPVGSIEALLTERKLFEK